MKSRLLLIDTGNFFQQNLGQRLRSEGFQLLFARRLNEVKKVVSKKKIDVALLDLAGLKMEGIRMAKAIKNASAETEIITINAADQLSLSIDVMKLGAFDDFLVPIEINVLIERIKAAAERKKTSERQKPSLFKKYQDIMMAATFAEAGSPEVAVTMLEDKTRDKRNKKEKQMAKDKKDKIKILLVDDEKEFVNTLSERIKMRELGADIAMNGEEALEIVDTDVPDVMVLDLRMPGIDGMEVLRRVKKSYPDVQVIILTGHGSEKDEEEARRLGAFDYLQKPVQIDTLVGKIRKAYKQKIESSLMASTFAEAGEFDTAQSYMDKDKKKK